METNIKLFNNDLLFREDGNTIMKPMEELFYNKRIVMFGLPGAFTPTCSGKQLPAYEDMYNLFMETGKVDDIYCLSVNDMFVMDAWGKDLGIKNVKLIPDGIGVFDNMLWSGTVLEPSDVESHALRETAELIKNNHRLEPLLMPIRDGVMVYRKNN